MKKYITGDLLHYKICNAKYLIEVTNTSKHGYCFKGVKDDFNGVICDEFIEDIPLTPEILEKNGWKKSKINDCAYFYYKDGLFLTYTSKDGKFWFDDFDYSSSICVELPYVHSLQHLLFGIGLNSEMEV